MNLIPQYEIDDAALKHAREFVEINDGNYFSEQDLMEYSQFDFKRGINFAESKLNNLPIEFAEWISKHKLDFQPASMNKGNFIGLDMKTYSPKELFEMFINEENINT